MSSVRLSYRMDIAASTEEAAFGRLYDRYARLVHGILLARIGRTDVDDLVQDVFFAAWNRLNTLRDPAAFGGWLATIARNRASDYHRREHVFEALPDTLPAPDSTATRVEALAILQIIRSLPDAYRETLVLRLAEGMTGPEIAERTERQPRSTDDENENRCSGECGDAVQHRDSAWTARRGGESGRNRGERRSRLTAVVPAASSWEEDARA